ncbi:MAG: ABC transporter substrate-binding protein, partial [Pseudomonadota bacterium]
AGTSDLNTIFRDTPEAFDLVVSSAMDLQFKLANDGYARRVEALDYPRWAQWRQSVFAFTSEPAAIVLNRTAFDGAPLPKTRQDLIRLLRSDPDTFKGKLGTYDVRASGVGYLFATQDARASETFWRLMEVMGNLDARLYCCSGDMIEDVASGEIAVAYNVLGSYAAARKDLAASIEVVLPADFQTVMMRTVLISGETTQPEAAEALLSFLLENKAIDGEYRADGLPGLDLSRGADEQSTIALEPALLTYLDAVKARRFLAEWADAIIQP